MKQERFGGQVYEINWHGVLGLGLALVVSLGLWTAMVATVARLVR